MFQRKRPEVLGADVKEWIAADGEPAGSQPSETRKHSLELLVSAGVDSEKPEGHE